MWKKATYKLTSSAPLIMHNGHLADPINKWAKALKQISSKKKKTDADYEELARLEFFGGLYMSADGPVIPAQCIEATLVNAAKKRSEGLTAKSGMFCDTHALLEYDGPRTAELLWQDEQFRVVNLVVVNRARIVRTRPIFNDWSTVISVSFDDEQVNLSTVDEWVRIGGSIVGLCDWRPKYGRYEAQRVG